MLKTQLSGIIAAPHTPFRGDGAVNLGVIEQQAEHLTRHGVETVFVCGTTGESHSLTIEERRAVTGRWLEVARGTPLRVIVHAGSNSLAEARTLAAHAQQAGAFAIAAMAPSYFKPRSVAALVDCCADVAAAAPDLPFFYYDIPTFTGVSLPMAEFLARAQESIPNLAGMKFTNADLMMFQQCLRVHGDLSVAWGFDECLLAALALGTRAAVGSTYNFAAPLYHRLWTAFARGDLAQAREEQFRSVQLIALLASRGFFGATKAVMQMLGIDVGPARLPNATLDAAQQLMLRADLERLGFFDWIES